MRRESFISHHFGHHFGHDFRYSFYNRVTPVSSVIVQVATYGCMSQ